MARKSFCEIYIHLIWRTRFNKPILGGDLELFVHRRMREIGEELKLNPLAVGSAWNHIHSYFRWHPSVAVSDAVRLMKSQTATEWNKEYGSDQLRWQIGYGAVSTRTSDVATVQQYVDDQKSHHQHDKIWDAFERIEYDENGPARNPTKNIIEKTNQLPR